jgi:hypothetical protein
MASPVRSWLARHAGRLPRIALFVTEGGRGGDPAMAGVRDFCPGPPLATLEVTDRALRSGAYRRPMREFVARLTEVKAAA